jgi:hypothetical protein
VRWLSEAADYLLDAVGSGRLGFDYAVKEYVELSEDELSRAFQGYVQALGLGDETSRASSKEERERNEEIRRVELHKLARQFDVPEVTAFVEALIESQDKQLSLRKTLEGQVALLRQTRSSA